ncbi:hypothetical protein N0V84_010427 [Fusarium piperis]|uniref:Uncharacterized protein n=1 Tax=Fusarium piperis TaxID=1435070 RepID=A0A9W8TC89_9HYPO|nr:hypothetical protein N0V84_010427 [Fusarium piperis]
MLINFETRDLIENPGPVKPQEQSLFFRKLIPDVRNLIYLEAFGYNEGARLLLRSNKLMFTDQAIFTRFFAQVPDNLQNSVRSLDICVRPVNCGYDLTHLICEMISSWPGDGLKLRMKWDLGLAGQKTLRRLAMNAIEQLMENPRILPKFWAPKRLEEEAERVLKKEDFLRLEFVTEESESDEWEDDEDEDSDDYDYGWDNDGEGYDDDDMTDMDYDDEEALRYWQALADQA